MMQLLNKKLLSNIMLIFAAGVWGSSIVFAKTATDTMGPATFFAGRYFWGSISLFIFIVISEYYAFSKNNSQAPRYDKSYFKTLFKIAPICSIANILGNLLVQMGLFYTSASKTGFLNSIYIIFVPILGYLFFKKKSSINIYIGLILAIIGLYNLCMTESLTIERGDFFILLSAIFFALHIQLIAKYVHKVKGLHFTCVEFSFATVVCIILSVIFETPSLEQFIICAPTILYTGILGTGLCYALQVTAQKYTDPTVTSLLMSLESVFSAILGVLVLNESFTAKEIIGIAFIISAVVISQLPSFSFKKQVSKKQR